MHSGNDKVLNLRNLITPGELYISQSISFYVTRSTITILQIQMFHAILCSQTIFLFSSQEQEDHYHHYTEQNE